MTSCTREELVSLLTMCCLQSQPEQICPVNRIISNEMCIELCKKEEKAIRDCCNSICSENNTFMKIFDQVSLYVLTCCIQCHGYLHIHLQIFELV